MGFENIKKRLLISFISNLIMLILFISSLIIEIINIINDPDSIYGNVWGLFRYFTIDGNLLTCIFNIIIWIKQFKALKTPIDDETFKDKAVSHFLYIISLISACNEIIIFIVVVLVFLPMSNSKMIKGLIGTYSASSVHILIPLILVFRFLFLDIRERNLKLYEKFVGGLPMLVYGLIMIILCGSKTFTSFDKKEGDGRIPYPFFDFYHQSWYFCFFIILFILVFGFGIGFLFDFLNKKCEKLIFPYDPKEKEVEGGFTNDNQQILVEQNA